MGKELPFEAFLIEADKQTNHGEKGTNFRAVGQALGLYERVSYVVAIELDKRKLIRLFLGGNMIITETGVLHVQGYDVHPKAGTEFNVPIHIDQVIGGDITNSQIQINSPGAHQSQIFEGMDDKQLLALMQSISDSIPLMKLNRENESALEDEISDIKQEIETNPDKPTMAQRIKRVCSILRTSSEIATVGAFLVQLLPLIGI